MIRSKRVLHYNSRCVYNPLIYYYNAFITANQSVIDDLGAVFSGQPLLPSFPCPSRQSKEHGRESRQLEHPPCLDSPRSESASERFSCVALLLRALIWLERSVDLDRSRKPIVLPSSAVLFPQEYTVLGLSVETAAWMAKQDLTTKASTSAKTWPSTRLINTMSISSSSNSISSSSNNNNSSSSSNRGLGLTRCNNQ